MTNYKMGKNVVERDLVDQKILLNLDDGEYYSLNETGAFIWSLIKNKCTQDDIIKELIEEFDVSEPAAKKDVESLLRTLKDKGLANTSPHS